MRAVREVCSRYSVDPKTPLDVFVRAGAAVAGDFQALAPFIISLAGVGKLECGPDVQKPKQAATHVDPDFEIYVSLIGLIDVPKEIIRLEKQLAEKKKFLGSIEAKLKNENFVKNAPAEVVEQQRQQVTELQGQIATMEENLRELKAG